MAACPNCSADNREGAKFCSECGAGLAMRCTACGTPYEAGQKFCDECGSALVAPEPEPAQPSKPVTPVAERRLVSVLFADLVGFTNWSATRDPEEVRAVLSRYFDTCRRLVELYGGAVEKFIGDAVMAVWGTPVATEDDAERAVRAALDLVAAVSALGQEVGAEGLRARAGVLTGEAAVDLTATGEGMVAGDLVNTASRVQSAAEPGSVFVGEATRRASERSIVYEDVGSFELKGKEGETRLWRARRVVSGARGQLKSQGLEPPFVGRDRELRQIKDLFHVCADEGRAQLVSVTGIAGIGKSRLAWEFYKYIDGLSQTTYWHRGRCLAYGEGVTYWALADMVRMRCRISEDEDPQLAAQKLRTALDEHILDAEERRFVEPRLAQLLGIGDQEARDRQDLFAAWRLFFERLAETFPTVLAFEDMQWADASLLDFVEHLLEWSRSHPLFVVTLARPELTERRSTWGAGHRNFTSLYLESLPGEAMEELLVGLVPGLPESLRRQILERAEGVPLYAVETVRMLLDRGLLAEEGSVYRVTGEIESLEVPETLHALIAARLDGLAPEERRVLADAAVLGKTFTPASLAALSGVERARLDELLTGLVRREILSLQSDPRSPEQGQYAFLQDLLRHVAYETLPKRERRARHLAAAAHLDATLGDDEVVEVVASHLVDAYRLDPDAADAPDLRSRAQSALVKAGERAGSLGASAEAQRYFEQAADLAAGSAEHASALMRAGEMAVNAGASERAALLFEQAIELAEGSSDKHAAARAAAWLALTEQRAGHPAKAIERMERAYETIAGDEPDADMAFLLIRLGSAHWFGGNPDQALKRAEQGLDLAESLQLPELLVRGWTTKAGLLAPRRPEESRGLFQLAFDTAVAHELYGEASSSCGNLSDVSFQRDRYEESLGHLERGVELARKIGDREHEWFALSEMTYALTMLGRWDEAFARLAELPTDALGAHSILLSPLSGPLEIYLHRGELDEARRLLARYDRLGRSGDVQAEGCYFAAVAAVRFGEGDLRGTLTAADEAFARAGVGIAGQNAKLAFVHALDAALELGDADKAAELLAMVDPLPIGLRPPFLDAMARRLRARLAAGNDAADRHFAAAESQLRDLSLPFYLAVVQLEHAGSLAARGLGNEAAALLSEARETFERLGAAPWHERAAAAAEAELDATIPA